MPPRVPCRCPVRICVGACLAALLGSVWLDLAPAIPSGSGPSSGLAGSRAAIPRARETEAAGHRIPPTTPPGPPRAPDAALPAAVAALDRALRGPDAVGRFAAAAALAKHGEESVPLLRAALRSPDRRVRFAIAFALGLMGAQAAPAVPGLAAATRDPDSPVRWAAVRALGRIGPASVAALREALRHPDPRTRFAACSALGHIGPPAADAVGDLAPMLSEYAPPFGSPAAQTLAGIGPAAVPALLGALRGTDRAAIVGAAEALRALGPAAGSASGEVVPALLGALRGEEDTRPLEEALAHVAPGDPNGVRLLAAALADPGIGQYAARAIGRMGPAGRAAAPALLDALIARASEQDGEATGGDPAWAAAEAMPRIDPSPEDALPALLRALAGRNATVRKLAASVLAELRWAPPEAVPMLVGMLGSPASRDRDAAMETLLRIGAPAVPALRAALRSDAPETRMEAALALARLRAATPDAVATLVEGLPLDASGQFVQRMFERHRPPERTSGQEPDGGGPPEDAALPTDGRCVDALAALGAEAVPALVAALGRADPAVRLGALQALSRAGRLPDCAIEAARDARGDGHLAVRSSAATLLAKAGGTATPESPALVEALGAPDHGVRDAAGDALMRAGWPAVPALARAMETGPLHVRVEAARVLHGIDPAAPGTARAAMGGLEDADDCVRYRAAIALGAMGAAARDAIPALGRVAGGDIREHVSYAATEALGAVGPDAVPALLAAARDCQLTVLLDDGTREYPVAFSGEIVRMGRDAVPALRAALRGGDTKLARRAADVLLRIGPDAAEAAPDLAGLLERGDADGRGAAARALGALGPAGRAALPALERACGDGDEGVRREAARAIVDVAGGG